MLLTGRRVVSTVVSDRSRFTQTDSARSIRTTYTLAVCSHEKTHHLVAYKIGHRFNLVVLTNLWPNPGYGLKLGDVDLVKRQLT